MPSLMTSYHPSRQNTQTGRLTWEMWISIFRQIEEKLASGRKAGEHLEHDRSIAALADAFGCVCTPHQTQPLGTIANLHFAAATPCCRYSQEYNIEPHPIGDRLFKNPVPVEDGHISVPEAPGLGVEVDEEILSRVV